jgi:hypothetical protein
METSLEDCILINKFARSYVPNLGFQRQVIKLEIVLYLEYSFWQTTSTHIVKTWKCTHKGQSFRGKN